MKTLFLDCGMGAAGDMLAAALMELTEDAGAFISEMNALGLPGVEIKREESFKCGIGGSHFTVSVYGEEERSRDVHEHEAHHDHESGREHSHDRGCHDHSHHDHGRHDHGGSGHEHRSLADVERLVRERLRVSEKVKRDVLSVYGLIAEAESAAHKVPASEIHFHEVGTMDALADVTAVCLLMEKLAPDEVVVTPVRTGYGSVECAHGILPVPAPATAYILQDVPAYAGDFEGETCTPTGAALLKHFATSFGQMPLMKVKATGYGMGRKDFPAANCVRAILGEREDESIDEVVELSCNVDDMTAEDIGFALERLLAEGAREAYAIPVMMKKSRPGTIIRLICDAEEKEAMVRAIFKHTSTIGVREAQFRRYVLQREIVEEDTVFGPLRVKRSQGYGVKRAKYEYEDLAAIAREKGLSIEEVRARIAAGKA